MKQRACSICSVRATWIVTRRGEEPLCDEHMDWLRANVTTMPPFREIGSSPKEQQATRQRRYAARQREKGVPKAKENRATKQSWYQRNKVRVLQQQKAYRRWHEEAIRRTKEEYYQANTAIFLNRGLRRRAALRSVQPAASETNS